MNQDKKQDVVKWCAQCGESFVNAYWSKIDAERLTKDADYGLKVLLFNNAYARDGAPKAYPIAAVKAVSSRKDSRKTIRELFIMFRSAKVKDLSEGAKKEHPSDGWNKSNNPVFSPKIDKLDVPSITKLVREGNLVEAFDKLELQGMGHKIRALFLWDLVILYKVEEKLKLNPEQYRYCQPIDVWVRIVVEALCGKRAVSDSKKYRLSPNDLGAVDNINELCRVAGVSPLKVNAGIWYFSANVVQDRKRLKELIQSGDVKKLQTELKLMEGFLPIRPSWG